MRLECLECGRKFRSKSMDPKCPKCPKCGSHDIDLAEYVPPRKRLVRPTRESRDFEAMFEREV